MRKAFINIKRKGILIFLLCCSIRASAHPAPVVDFVMSPFCLGDTAYFTNLTTRADYYTWNIYKQNQADTFYTTIYNSTDLNIKFKFSQAGKYRIELIGDNGHVISLVRSFTIKQAQTPDANFSYHDCLSHYVNMSTCYSSCKWLFGDGQTSTEFSPIHYYASTGKYKVSLIAYNGSASDTISDSVYVYTVNNLNGEFTYKVNKDSVFFHANDSISGPFTLYSWVFGDGTTFSGYFSTGRKIYHTYQRKDTTYTVFMLARSLCLTSFSSHSILVPDSTPVYKTSIYPNPLQNSTLHILCERKTEVSKIVLNNSQGQRVGFSIVETTRGFNIDIAALPAGLYFLSIYFKGKTLHHKLLKE
ncbi:MAG: T9SS type A sorting domain-containing protein [Bacteroidetes bacterium]|nr:T9SS type A sorting domain-containing protein [Bacteroidota bacterium]